MSKACFVCIRDMNFSSEDCIVVEDSSIGVEATLRQGMSVISFLRVSHVQYERYQQRFDDYGALLALDLSEVLMVFASFLSVLKKNN